MRKHELGYVAESPRLPFDGLVASVRSDRPAAEVLGHEFDHLAPVGILADRDAWSHLPPDPDFGPRADRNGEASFTVEIAGDVRLDVVFGARARVLRRL